MLRKLSVFILIAVFMFACEPQTKEKKKSTAVTGVTLDKTSLSIKVGESVTLTSTIRPANASNKSVTWVSSDESIAAVNSGGTVTGVKAGNADITVTTADGSKTAVCKVTVTDSGVVVINITLNKTATSLVVGKTETLYAGIEPDNASDKSVTWSSSDETVAKVDSNGLVTAVKAGTAIISVTTADGGKKADCTVTVVNEEDAVSVTGVSLSEDELTMQVGQKKKITAVIEPLDATNQNITWSSSDENIVIVSKSGELEAKSAGEAVITVKTEDGEKEAECKVIVEETIVVTGVSLSESTISVVIEKKINLTAKVEPDNALNKAVVWSSSDEGVAAVDSNGVVTGIKLGTATITVTTVDGGKTADCEVTVINESDVKPVTGVTIDKTSVTISIGGTETLTAAVEPSDATNKKIIWESSDTEIAVVSEIGVVTGIKAGTAKITATADGTDKKAECSITVNPNAGIGFDFN